MSEFNASNFKKEEGGQGPDLCGTTELTSPYFMVPPSGTTEQRPQGCAPGTLRFNTDIGSLEYFKGDTLGWESINRTSPNLGGGTGSNTGFGARIAYAGGHNGTSAQDVIDFITVSTLGNAQDFGDMTTTTARPGGCGSRTRGLLAGGNTPSVFVNTIEYITFASTGDASNFGDLVGDLRWYCSSLASQTRGIWGGGYTPVSPAGNRDTIEFVTIASEGNAVDFGNLTAATRENSTGASSTRGLFAGGKAPVSSIGNKIDYITIATTGNAVDFGDATPQRCAAASAASSTRMLIGAGLTPGNVNHIDYITMATLGNSVDFGDTTTARGLLAIGVSSDKRRGIFSGANNDVNIMDYVEIATTGNALDFGDLSVGRYSAAAMSNAHGGL